ncbi:Fic family protein [Streptomyces marincola]|uniref:Fic family protein n=1 Tax=Streptomyces marincola TaxID=2878388 RepID=UPI001CF23114|nr:Fic family protein [Streptomyces marincola]UCM88293.1 Fic family protein [Streptomyces marincola]
MTRRDMPWAEVEPLPELNGDLTSLLASVHALRRAWKAVVSANTEAFQEARRRSLRRHAIETGIIERLYDVDWGVTEALVAEGLTADAVARAGDGSLSEDVLDIIRSQYDALEFLAQAAREGRDVSVSLVRQLHVALTRLQPTYGATGPTGAAFQATLHHGEWKTQPNHVTRPDGSMLYYTPPEQVASQMDRLMALYRETESHDPVVRAAWLHHRFVRIHPFEDGNGRVARCLTLLGLLRCDLAPLVVDRRERNRYLLCLDQANEGDLRPLVRFFAELEIVALRSELERPPAPLDAAEPAGGAVAVLEAGLDRLRRLQTESGARRRAEDAAALAGAVHRKVESWLRGMADQFAVPLTGVDSQARTSVQSACPPDARARFWRWQVVQAARSVDFYVNLQQGVWWTRLRLVALGQELRYLVFIQKVGRGETGVLALTVYAEMLDNASDESAKQEAERLLVSSPTETVTWIHSDAPEAHWASVVDVLDTTLAGALHKFTSALG